MKLMPTPFRFLDALAPQRRPIDRVIEPMLHFDSLSPPQQPMEPQPLGRGAIERALEEGSRRVYVPMLEAEVIERARPRR